MADTMPQDVGGLELTKARNILRIEGSQVSEDSAIVAAEYALTIFVNDEELATVVCTPEYLEDMVIGFLASEGVIRSIDQVTEVSISQYRGVARVRTTNTVNFNQAFYNKRYIASCCGKSRQTFYFYNDAHTAKTSTATEHLHVQQILHLMDQLDEAAGLFRVTGGVHIAGLCSSTTLLHARTDIGRHNALDKLYGYALQARLTLENTIVTFSGRLSSEVLLKVAKIGAGIVLAKSAPTALALDTAEALNITTVGFIRGDALNVYTHPWRIDVS